MKHFKSKCERAQMETLWLSCRPLNSVLRREMEDSQASQRSALFKRISFRSDTRAGLKRNGAALT